MELQALISQTLFFTAVLLLRVHCAPCDRRGKVSAKPPQISTTGDLVLENAGCEYSSLDRDALMDDVLDALDIIIDDSLNIHHQLFGDENLWATVGLYGGAITPIGHMHMADVHRNLSASVAVFHTFLRPFGQALTEETLRQVVLRDRDAVSTLLSKVYRSLASAALKVYQLIKNDPDIHECIVPYLPANLNVTLQPSHIQQDLIPKHKLVVDGLLNELTDLAIGVKALLKCMKDQTGTCEFY